ncbi:MAG: hypothetical protein L3J96_03305, partial [Thermoplasmata archaeon]|nr:hypothetical protein [Thermoplasmata archaeon]
LVVSVVANPTPSVLGSSLEVVADVAGGTAPYVVSWNGLPPGCPTRPATLEVTCSPTAPGEFNVNVWVNDSAGQSRHANVTIDVSATGPVSPNLPAWQMWALVAALAILGGVTIVAVLGRMRRRPQT